MRLKRILNNNVLLVADAQNAEKVVFGVGIAYGRKKGDEVDVSLIERTFISDPGPETSRFAAMVQDIPPDALRIAEDIILYASSILKRTFTPSLYIALADHIQLIERRYKSGLAADNPLKWEILRYYPDEYRVGAKALALLSEEFGLQLPEDEAASITMHIINASMETSFYSGVEMLEVMNTVTQIIRLQCRIDLAESSLSCQRLVTHLKYFITRVIKNIQYADKEPLFAAVQQRYPEAFACADKIKSYIEGKYPYRVTYDELSYLTIHIQRVLLDAKEQHA